MRFSCTWSNYLIGHFPITEEGTRLEQELPVRAMEALKKQTQSERLLKVGLAGKALSMTIRGHAPVEADGEVDSGSEKGFGARLPELES